MFTRSLTYSLLLAKVIKAGSWNDPNHVLDTCYEPLKVNSVDFLNLANYGCWCQKTANEKPMMGVPIDEMDRLCRDYNKCLRCADCDNDVTPFSADLNSANCSLECHADDGDACGQAKCECTSEFVEKAWNLVKANVEASLYSYNYLGAFGDSSGHNLKPDECPLPDSREVHACPGASKEPKVEMRDCTAKYSLAETYVIPKEKQLPSLGFLLDFSGSMGSVLNQIKGQLESVTTTLGEVYENGIVVAYSDPTAKMPGAPTSDTSTFQSYINGVNACTAVGVRECGGDCPEAAFKSMDVALESTRDNSRLFLFTDATGLDESLVPGIIAKAKAQGTKVNIVLNRAPCGRSIYTPYQQIADETNGQVIKASTYEIGPLVNSFKKAKLFEKHVDTVKGHGTLELVIPTPNSVSDVTIQVSGSAPSVSCRNQKGETSVFDTLLSISNAKTVSFPRITAGSAGSTKIGFAEELHCTITAGGEYSVIISTGSQGCSGDSEGSSAGTQCAAGTCIEHEDCRLFECACPEGTSGIVCDIESVGARAFSPVSEVEYEFIGEALEDHVPEGWEEQGDNEQ